MTHIWGLIRSWLRRTIVVWVDVLPGRGGRPPRGVGTGAVPYAPAARSKKKARAFYAAVDETLAKFAEMKTRKAIRALARMPPIEIGLSTTFMERFTEYVGDVARAPNAEVYDLVEAAGLINLCLMGHISGDDPPIDDPEVDDPFNADRLVDYAGRCGWWVGHYHSASLRTLRGRSLRSAPANLTAKQRRRGYIPAARDPLLAATVLAADFVFSDDARAGEFTANRLAVSGGGTEWQMLERDGRLVGSVEEARLAAMIYALDWGNRFLWSVTIHRPPIAARYHCDARNVLELLWMRDKAAGGRRRKAMIHLVRPHERRLPSGDVTTVRPHLRGAVECDWDEWRIEIKPSEHDYEVLSRRMLPGQDMLEFIEANCDELAAARVNAA